MSEANLVRLIRRFGNATASGSPDVDVVSMTLSANITLESVNLNKYLFVSSAPASLTKITLPTATQGKYVCVRNSSTNPFLVDTTTIPVGESRTFICVAGVWTNL